MFNSIVCVVCVVILAMISGCEAIQTPYGSVPLPDVIVAPYEKYDFNIRDLRKIGYVKINLIRFTSYKQKLDSIVCREAAVIKAPHGDTFAKYIENAFKSELSSAGIYNKSSPYVLYGNLRNIDFNSMSGLGKWVFTLEIISSNSRTMTVHTTYSFSTAFGGGTACKIVAKEFPFAVQKLIHDIVNSHEFDDLLE